MRGERGLGTDTAISNFIELRSTLEDEGIRFRTSSDTEMLLELLAHPFLDAIRDLKGMFAFVFHDQDTNQWIAVRDPFGIKPLYLARVFDALAFAFEIKAFLRHDDIVARPDLKSLAQYVAFKFTVGRRAQLPHGSGLVSRVVA